MTGGGDTPEENTYFAYQWSSAGSPPLFAGKIVQGQNFKNLEVYCNDLQEMTACNFGPTGVRSNSTQKLDDFLQQQLCDKIGAAIGEQIELIIPIACPVAVGESLENWADYTVYSK